MLPIPQLPGHICFASSLEDWGYHLLGEMWKARLVRLHHNGIPVEEVSESHGMYNRSTPHDGDFLDKPADVDRDAYVLFKCEILTEEEGYYDVESGAGALDQCGALGHQVDGASYHVQVQKGDGTEWEYHNEALLSLDGQSFFDFCPQSLERKSTFGKPKTAAMFNYKQIKYAGEYGTLDHWTLRGRQCWLELIASDELYEKIHTNCADCIGKGGLLNFDSPRMAQFFFDDENGMFSVWDNLLHDDIPSLSLKLKSFQDTVTLTCMNRHRCVSSDDCEQLDECRLHYLRAFLVDKDTVGDGGNGASVWPLQLRITNKENQISMSSGQLTALIGDAAREAPFFFGMGVGASAGVANTILYPLLTREASTIAQADVNAAAENAYASYKYLVNMGTMSLMLASRGQGFLAAVAPGVRKIENLAATQGWDDAALLAARPDGSRLAMSQARGDGTWEVK